MSTFFIRVKIGDAGAMGPGKARLLELVDETGSIRSAAKAMDISYRRAWQLLQDTEATFGAPVLERQTGGKRGGGAVLTLLGRNVVKHYRAIESKTAGAIGTELAALNRLKRGNRVIPSE